ncbi:hypothetical protein B0H14DRAFT_2601229 [Mycena olivaceomarginata]|nr:hypothetical protein B0H14DRAFT_2601229 [Mycena olivaceomarginata]
MYTSCWKWMPEQMEAPVSNIFATHIQDAHARIPFPVSIAATGVRRPSPRRNSIVEIQNDEKLTSLLNETMEAVASWSALRWRSATVSRTTAVKEHRSPGISSVGRFRVW